MATQFNIEPEPTEWPYWWPMEYDLAVPTTCVCDGSGWLPLPDETMVTCYGCNNTN